MHVVVHCSIEELMSMARLKRYVQIRERLRGVVLAMEGHTAPEIARTFGRGRRTVAQALSRTPGSPRAASVSVGRSVGAVCDGNRERGSAAVAYSCAGLTRASERPMPSGFEQLRRLANAPARSKLSYTKRLAAKELLECLRPGRYGTIALHRMLDRLIGYPVTSVDLKAQLSCEKRIFIVEDFDRVKFEGPHGVIDTARIDPETGKARPEIVDTVSLPLPPS